jgi:hypothetical protein
MMVDPRYIDAIKIHSRLKNWVKKCTTNTTYVLILLI